MFKNFFKSALLKGFLKLPLWGKIAVPVALYLAITWILPTMVKLILTFALIGLIAWFFIRSNSK